MLDITGQIQAAISEENNPELETVQEENQEDFVETQVEDTVENSSDKKEENKQQASTDPKESWKELQRQAEEGKQYKRKLQEAYELLAAMEKKNQHYEQKPKSETQKRKDLKDILSSLSDDEYSNNKELKRILLEQYEAQQERDERILREIEEQKIYTKRTAVEQRIYKNYPDFEDVCSDENVSKLKSKYPSLFRSIAHNPDQYDQAETSYKAIMDLGLYQKPAIQRQDQQLKNNLLKPKSAAAVGSNQKQNSLSNASRYNYPTQEELDAAYNDMMQKTGRSLSYNE